jgi:CP family cyanate transporter-like MFS transporter
MRDDNTLAGAAAHGRQADSASMSAQPQAHAPRLWLAITLVLVGMNLRPALSSMGAVLDAVSKATGMSSAAAGMLTTLPILCFGLFAPFAPRLARRASPEFIILASLLILAGSMGLRVLSGIAGLFAGTLVVGASISVVMVLVPGIIKREFADRTGLAMGLYSTALCLGSALSAGATVPVQNLAGGDWRYALAFWLLPVLAAALAWWPQLRHGAQRAAAAHYTVRGMHSSALAWQVTVFMGSQSALAYCVFGWLPTILIDRGMAPLDAGYVLSVSIAVQQITALSAPWFSTRGKDQRLAIALLAVMSLAGLLGCLYAPIGALWTWSILLGLGQGGCFSIALTLIVLRARDAHVAAALSGMAQGFGYTIAACGPLVVGVLHDATHGWDEVAVFFTAISLAVLVSGLLAGRNRYVDAQVVRID